MRGLLIAVLAALLPAPLAARDTSNDDTRWAFEKSDIPVDPDFRFGRLDNGMRYIVRHNATPAGTGVVRMEVEAGSLDESDSERGYAHFVEHMAFNGSTHVPEGEMIRLLERDGLAFGADTNASTGFERTVYKLDLPRNDPALLDTALMLMRETASNLTISQGAVERERGVVLSEMRDRNTWSYRNAFASTHFFYPASRYGERFPIGTAETLKAATSASLRSFYQREYVPSHAVLVVVGDFDTAAVEAGIRRHFASWSPALAEKQPDAGPVYRMDRDRSEIYLDPALSERMTVLRNGRYRDEPDTIAERQENLLRTIGYRIVNRRLQRLARSAKPPFRDAGFGTGDVFKAARSTRLIVDTVDGAWQRGLETAAREYRRALAHGFTQDEVTEQIARIRTSLVDAAGAAETRSNGTLASAALSLVNDAIVPSTPASALERFEAFAPGITPEVVMAAMKREAIPLEKPLIRFQGRVAPEGGSEAIQETWRRVMRETIVRQPPTATASFDYTDFGPPGEVVSDRREPELGIREVRFANGVMLNLKHTDIEKDKVRISLAVDGGDMLDTKADPLASEMAPYLAEGGLGKHSRDELDSILAGRTVGLGLSRGAATFDTRVRTTPRDLELQLDLMTALIRDPGYRPEGEVQYRQSVNNYFAQLRATPSSALEADLGAILSDNDPRFSLQRVEDYRHLTFAKLRQDIGDRLARGAIEVGVVGDIDEDRVIALVGETLGALPPREAAFRSYSDQPPRMFTTDRSTRVIRHTGPADQALLRIVWPTRDDSDPLDTLRLEMLERVIRVELTDQLREALGKAYSPSASSYASRHWKGYGVFSVNASVDVADVPATRAAIQRVVSALNTAPVSADMFRRARQPLLESLHNALKSNGGWLSLVDRAQTEPDRIDRYEMAKERLLALTPADITIVARRYLAPGAGLEVLVLPEGVAVPE
ncbi:M16 family metallopeptidase [Novosphingobium mangrovi (ex Huang et al. 2023)]|uniref:Insulinase family protein n=1 Tax=Novosphingobium mangrovi (ex Huang et al. 2023) TaxID=2976432 RepID=A0ABT2I6M6_9SPHN|nr:M16 family metallopeptidase [Novosphingobium mangrovi (ex Huang et al. 2023)]MCT2400462.1 insulinase family protein [Novosphingobium mangrovi (ex Huang et al. 2023)]